MLLSVSECVCSRSSDIVSFICREWDLRPPLLVLYPFIVIDDADGIICQPRGFLIDKEGEEEAEETFVPNVSPQYTNSKLSR